MSTEGVDPAVALERISFDDLEGWRSDDHAAAFSVFLRSCARVGSPAADPRPAGSGVPNHKAICDEALAAGTLHERAAWDFFETRFCPHVVTDGDGLLTSYYEPELPGSLEPTAEFSVPLYALPDDLVNRRDADPDLLWPGDVTAAMAADEQSYRPYHDRNALDGGILDGRGLELVYLADPVDAFFVHIQGSTRIRLKDGSSLRIGYAGKNGHPYTSVGRALLRDGMIDPTAANAEAMKSWMRANPAVARIYMHMNRSFVFFRVIDGLDDELGPVGGQGVQLTAGRSLAIDRDLYAYGLPFWIEADLPGQNGAESDRFQRLMVAQDTGAAIKGPTRGDIFWGTGGDAGAYAGQIKVPGKFVILLPCGTT
ncbi:MAG: MltA domain-containing protein [Pseudomonadota bacterium]